MTGDCNTLGLTLVVDALAKEIMHHLEGVCALGTDAELFRKVKVCISQGYGLAACAYMRRVLENQINPILKLIHANRKSHGAPDTELRKIQSVITGKAHVFAHTAYWKDPFVGLGIRQLVVRNGNG